MLKQRKITKILYEFPYLDELSKLEMHKASQDGVDEALFINYLLHKKKYRKWKYKGVLSLKPPFIKSCDTDQKLELQRINDMKHILDTCNHKFIIKHPNPHYGSRKLLKVAPYGYKSFNWLFFFELCLQEYPSSQKIIIGIIAGIPFTFLLQWLWQ